jgi:hypothetical protein
MRAVLFSIAAAGCGNDIGLPDIDAAGVGGPPGSPSVVVMGPRQNDSFYPSQSATITWVATDDDTPSFTCDVTALAGTSLPIASAVMTTSGASTSTPWMLASVAPGSYRVSVACTDKNGLTGAGLSAMFQVSAAPQAVDYATQIQPIWNASCTDNACHDATQPSEGLNLTPAASRAELNANSGQCGAYKLVEPGQPERSYLVFKLQGSGPCLIGTKMPKANQSLPAAQIQLVRDWIFNGAP